MKQAQKHRIAAVILAVLGLAIGVIGISAGLVPPVITGVGFLVLAWALY
ncbi:MAG TPA: hypothetical protein VJ960_01415 [Oceanipulchritudo sp.]|nr:hypothetical protein [Oceanipulchritudo sp.]